MSDPLLDQLAGSDGPLDPGSTFRERLWQQVEAELVRPAAEPAVAAAVVEPHPADRRPSRAAGALGWIRASRARTVPVAAGLVALLSLGAGVALRDGENPDGEQTVRVVDEPSPGPASPSPVPSLGPPAVVGG
ncbi:MAG TPA: hypothetical protein VNA12_08870, partial [Mycobacteriales bacterium]|nr:hypothetical protein [Mycobacteriales bacterium]